MPDEDNNTSAQPKRILSFVVHWQVTTQNYRILSQNFDPIVLYVILNYCSNIATKEEYTQKEERLQQNYRLIQLIKHGVYMDRVD